MTMSARPIAVAAPPMSFFISPIEAGGLMSSPPVSKQTPLPTSVTFGASVAAPGEVEQPRRLGGGGAHRLDHRQVRRPERRRAAGHRDLGAVPAAPSATKAASSASGPMSRAGVLIRSCASAAAAAIRSTRAASTPSGQTSSAAAALPPR